MEHNDYKALLVAANLSRCKGSKFMIFLNKWKSFLGEHHFIDLPSHLTAPRLRPTKKGWYSMGNARLCMSSESDEKVICGSSPPPRINSLSLQQQKFRQDTELAIVHMHIELFVSGMEDSLLETTPSKSLAPQIWAYPMLMQQQKSKSWETKLE